MIWYFIYVGVFLWGIKYTTFDYTLKFNIKVQTKWFYSKIESITYLIKCTYWCINIKPKYYLVNYGLIICETKLLNGYRIDTYLFIIYQMWLNYFPMITNTAKYKILKYDYKHKHFFRFQILNFQNWFIT